MANMLSYIVPAHNEELWIGKCLHSIRTTMEKVGEPYEVIVVDDASTDSTLQIARQTGVRTLRVEHRKISAVRNAGARAARGEIFFFVDADTQVNERAVLAALTVVRNGAAGGGCVIDLDGPTPLWGRVILFFAVLLARSSGGWEVVSFFAPGKPTLRRADFPRACMRAKTSRSFRHSRRPDALWYLSRRWSLRGGSSTWWGRGKRWA